MNAERARRYLLGLPHVVEKAQFGGIIFYVGDLAIGGKMFTMINPNAGAGMPVSLLACAERMPELLELDGMLPAPYLARVFWVAAERWDVLRDRQWEAELQAAHALTLAKLPPCTRKLLDLPRAELKRVVAERVKVLAERNAAKSALKG